MSPFTLSFSRRYHKFGYFLEHLGNYRDIMFSHQPFPRLRAGHVRIKEFYTFVFKCLQMSLAQNDVSSLNEDANGQHLNNQKQLISVK